MVHKAKSHDYKHRHRNYKHLAAAAAAAAFIGAGLLPAMSPAVAQAAASPPAQTQQSNAPASKKPVVPKPAGRRAPASKKNDTAQATAPAHHKDKGPGKGAKPPENYRKILNLSATAYAPGPHDNDQWGNKTHLGTTIRPGVIAVDPDLIPLGTQVYILYPDGHGEYAVAEDTGGAIKGHRVDIAKSTVDEAEAFGIQNVKVFVLPAEQA